LRILPEAREVEMLRVGRGGEGGLPGWAGFSRGCLIELIKAIVWSF